MGWRVGTQFFVAGGSTMLLWFSWGAGDDKGPQWAMAHPIPGEPDVPLVTERVGKKLICEIGQVTINGPATYRCVGTGSNYEYYVWIKNDGASGCKYQLEGGGV
jgi:hypothetical protein